MGASVPSPSGPGWSQCPLLRPPGAPPSLSHYSDPPAQGGRHFFPSNSSVSKGAFFLFAPFPQAIPSATPLPARSPAHTPRLVASAPLLQCCPSRPLPPGPQHRWQLSSTLGPTGIALYPPAWKGRMGGGEGACSFSVLGDDWPG